jgi:hypothetical protein
LGLSVEWEDHFFVESGAFDQVGFAQMVGLVGIDCSFDLGIEMAAEVVSDHQEGDLIVDESPMRFAEGHLLEFLEAFLVAEHLFVGELPRLRQLRNPVRR